ncbi:MAG: type III pantothenate kinase [Gammaproteobacteria bacterium]|nr:type III pantothenate kinase [Gammaproteobacteria bacterium]
MNLLIDLGNTRLKWASYHNMQMVTTGGYKYNTDQMLASFSREWGNIAKPDKICVSSDVDFHLANQLIQWIDAHWGMRVHIITPKDQAYGVKNAYENPLQLGSDRWAALVAVKNNIKQAAIIVDCGTAITIDAITDTGVHQGGLILPGLQLMQDSLLKGTHKIETVFGHNIVNSKELLLPSLASNTIDGIRNGVHTAVVSFICSAVEYIHSTLSKPTLPAQPSRKQSSTNQSNNVQIANIITGGDADTLLPFLEKSFLHRPQLVLEGLAIILDRIE